MKAIILSLFLNITSALFGQISKVDQCGLDANPILNQCESTYFNEVFADRRGDFDFTGKTIAFSGGSAGKTVTDKTSYFNVVRSSNNANENIHEWMANGTQLLILSSAEKAICGYDAILVSWSKLQIEGKSRAKLVKDLNI